MAIFDAEAARSHQAEYEAINNSGVFIFLVAVVAIMIAVPLAIFF